MERRPPGFGIDDIPDDIGNGWGASVTPQCDRWPGGACHIGEFEVSFPDE